MEDRHSRTKCFDLSICSGRGQLCKMSALQTFLLVVDHNKDEAKQIAEQVAGGECLWALDPGLRLKVLRG